MNPDEQLNASRLARAWDDLVGGKGTHDAPPDLLADIQFAREVTAVPSPSPDLRATIWQQVNGRSLPSSMSSVTVARSPNGVAHHALAPEPGRAVAASPAFNSFAILRLLAIGVVAGFASGFASGLWVRFAMRIAGLLTSDQNRGRLTEADAVVGEVTVGGTLFIAFVAAIIGIIGGILYLVIRRWLPRRPGRRAVAYGFLLLAVFGFILMDENNKDYQLFGPAWLNVITFCLTYVVFGIITSLIAERLDARWVQSAPAGTSQVRRVVTGGPVLFLGSIGVIALFFVIVLGAVEPSATIVTALLLAVGLWRLIPRLSFRINVQSPAFATLGLCAALVPSLFGLALTVQGIASILAG